MNPNENRTLAKAAFAPYVDQHRWVSWVDEDGKKLPINPTCRHRNRASSTDPTTWATFDWAVQSVKRFGLSGVGFVFLEGDDIVGVDLDDCRHPITGEITGWAWDIVKALDSYAEISPSGTGLKVWVKSHDLTRAHKDNAIGIEIYPHGRYFTVTGRGIYGDTIKDASAALTGIIKQYFDRPEYAERSRIAGVLDFKGAELSIDDWVHDALLSIDPDSGYHTWLSVGMGLHNGYNGSSEGLSVWESWSASSRHFNIAEIDTKWQSFKGDGVTPGSIWNMAEQGGWKYDRVDDWGAFGGLADADTDDVQSTRDSLERIQWMDAATLYRDDRPYEPYLVDPQIIGKSDVVMLFGPPKSMKTLVCMDMCRQWSAGKPWMDLTVDRPLRIAYFNFEIKKDNLRRRLKLAALDDAHVDAMRGNFWLTNRFVDSFGARFIEEALTTLASQTAAMTEGKGWDLVVIDPLIDLFDGDSENDNKQVKDFINGLKRLAHKIDPDAALMLVHHANKTNRKERHAEPFNSLRGGSAFRGSYDTGISVDWEDETRDVLRVAFECRNGPGAENRRVAFNDKTGFFDSVGSLVGDRTSERQAGEIIGETWDKEALRKAKTICDLILEQGESGIVYTKRDFARVYANKDRYGLGSESTIARKIDELIVKGVVGYFYAQLYGGPVVGANSKGHLCCAGMRCITSDGEVVDVEPVTVYDMEAGQLVSGNELSTPEMGYFG